MTKKAILKNLKEGYLRFTTINTIHKLCIMEWHYGNLRNRLSRLSTETLIKIRDSIQATTLTGWVDVLSSEHVALTGSVEIDKYTIDHTVGKNVKDELNKTFYINHKCRKDLIYPDGFSMKIEKTGKAHLVTLKIR